MALRRAYGFWLHDLQSLFRGTFPLQIQSRILLHEAWSRLFLKVTKGLLVLRIRSRQVLELLNPERRLIPRVQSSNLGERRNVRWL